VNEAPSDDALVETIEIAASPERVFQALTDPKQLVRWWGDPRQYVCNNWELDLRVGGRWRSEGKSANGQSFQVEGAFLEIEPPWRLAFTWLPSWIQVAPTTVRIVLEATRRGTRLTWTHSGFAGNPNALADHRGGLPSVLGWLRSFLEEDRTARSRG
jgi:uncharacterized protein YndB with AHSA1/START domain